MKRATPTKKMIPRVAVCIALLTVLCPVEPIHAQRVEESTRMENSPAGIEHMKMWIEYSRNRLLPAGFMRDMSGIQATPVSDVSSLRQGIDGELRKMGFSVAIQPVPSFQTTKHAWFEFRNIRSDTPEFREIESVDIRIRLFPDLQDAETGFVTDAMRPSIGFQPGTPDGSRVGEASAFAGLDTRRQVSVFVLRRNASFEVSCDGTVRESKMASAPTAPINRIIMSELPSRCTEIARVVDQWLRDAK